MRFIAVRCHYIRVQYVYAVSLLEINIPLSILLHLNQVDLRATSDIQLKGVCIVVIRSQVYGAVKGLSHRVGLDELKVVGVEHNAKVRVADYNVVLRDYTFVARTCGVA
jgi:hypothetical protein